MNPMRIIERVGPFTITDELGRNYLYDGETKIAECVNGDYRLRFGGIEGWLEEIKKREDKRINKIGEQIEELEDEEYSRRGCIYRIATALSSHQ